MRTKMIDNIFYFSEAKTRLERIRRSRRMEEMRGRFERAMGWKEKPVISSGHSEKTRKQQHR